VDGPQRHRCAKVRVVTTSDKGAAQMTVTMLGLDTAKTAFQVHGIDGAGKVVVRRKLRRGELISFFEQQAACTVVMEACGAAHHWARLLAGLGHDVKLIAPEAVKPFVKRGRKNDAVDAAAICEAARRPDVKFVPVKTVEQQGILALHSARSLLVKQQTMLANALRGLATEFGLTVPQGIGKLGELMTLVDADESLPKSARQAARELFDRSAALAESIETFEAEIVARARGDETARRLATIPGIGPVTASLIAATVADIGVFGSARRFAAWLGLVPRQYSTGGKTVGGMPPTGRITKAGNPEIRRLLVPGRHIDGSPGRAVEQRGGGLDPGCAGAPSGQTGDSGPGQQDGAHRVGGDDARGGLPPGGTCHGLGMTLPGGTAEGGRELV
jgi:transposase